MEVKPLSHEEIEDAVGIHIRSIGYSINALLGKKHLAELYSAILKSEFATSFVAIESGGRVVGAITGASDIGAFRSSLFRVGVIARSAASLALRPKAWRVLLQSFVDRSPAKPPSTTATLTSIAVDEKSRGSGIGRKLVQFLENDFASRGVNQYWLETRKDNAVAKQFYLNIGFREYSRGSRDLCLVKEVVQASSES